jgi:amino acid transporter
VAYGPEAILVVLATAGLSALHLVVPVTVAIVVLLVLLVISYRQVIDAYPHGGGAYAVSRDNFGPRVSQLAGAALIVDYVLTVAVSIAAGVGSLVSAFPGLAPATVPLCLGILLLITLLNLRGLGASARAFLAPTLLFIVGLLVVILIGLVHPLGRGTTVEAAPLVTKVTASVTLLLGLKAFAAGCSALTGVEAIANGVPLFKEPRVQRAKRTEAMLGLILGVMLLGLAVLADRFHVQPRVNQTALSQIIFLSVGHNWAYYALSVVITVVLALAANTSFGGLPVLTALLAQDHYLPRFFGIRGERLVFGYGIVALAVLSGALLVAVGGETNALIPLFAIGVFTGFTLAQSGLVVHWRRRRPPGWRRRAVINGTGAVMTGVATVVFLLTKFTEGAWVVVLTMPALMVLFWRIERYYRRAHELLELGEIPRPPKGKRTRVVVPVLGVSRATARALSEAVSLSDDVVAVTVVFDDEAVTALHPGVEEDWARWNPGVPLCVLHTDYASITGPIASYVDHERNKGDAQLVVLIPVVVPRHWWHRVLHNQADLAIAAELRRRPDVVVARVPVLLDEDAPPPRVVPLRGGGPA